MRFIAAILVCVFTSACTSVSTAPRPDYYYDVQEAPPRSSNPQSLFSADATTLSDEEIAAIMNTRYAPPAPGRIALVLPALHADARRAHDSPPARGGRALPGRPDAGLSQLLLDVRALPAVLRIELACLVGLP